MHVWCIVCLFLFCVFFLCFFFTVQIQSLATYNYVCGSHVAEKILKPKTWNTKTFFLKAHVTQSFRQKKLAVASLLNQKIYKSISNLFLLHYCSKLIQPSPGPTSQHLSLKLVEGAYKFIIQFFKKKRWPIYQHFLHEGQPNLPKVRSK
jgi:hypothetical protein